MPAVEIPTYLMQQMRIHITSSLPNEACGLVGGISPSTFLVVRPIKNILESPVAFKMDPDELILALNEFDRNQMDLVAIYHSHPQGPPHPSQKDMEEFHYPECLMWIWFSSNSTWELSVFKVENRQFEKCRVKLA